MEEKGNVLFPIFLKIDQLNLLVVGGGNVGEEKLEALLKNNPEANVTVVSIDFKDEVRELAKKHPSIKLIHRAFEESDLDDAEVAILATADREVNREIKVLAKKRKVLTNVADTPDLCDFYLGSTVKKGDLKIGISTNGKSPTFAKRFRQVLEEILPEQTDELLQNLRIIRDKLKGDFSYKVEKLNEVTASLVDKDLKKK
ncbi:bifunctional precorrin-2 dehydrogenase/sirohydrochlorin ferrochelatase [Flammeovirgaceae bacterium SG7u.111]|nr:bifunctional precorrin-2 dehydrogenase/sirohydrochlorin ferrochelatase [Flammeovirgaceae bacterium SG7u.132]WPO35311.1 bifunctional precorrin-2 dehydrogenase/sirohydrochlorin ferrochelatase [Flammeovirgaceae bacterium SG7u.111]